jgi:hypothetical protein
VGWEKHATLRMLTWEAQWLQYTAKQARSLAAPAAVVPVFDRAPMGSTVSIALPKRAAVQGLGAMQV